MMRSSMVWAARSRVIKYTVIFRLCSAAGPTRLTSPRCLAPHCTRMRSSTNLMALACPSGGGGSEIRFYTERQSHFFLTNYAPAPFTIADKVWPTVEHYFQAMKFPSNPDYQERVRTAATPGAAKRMGATKDIPIRSDWDAARDGVMRAALRAKFDSNAELKAGLLSTGSSTLIENSPTDYYWGCGKDRTGRSMLGRLLMELREQYREEHRTAAAAAAADGAAAVT